MLGPADYPHRALFLAEGRGQDAPGILSFVDTDETPDTAGLREAVQLRAHVAIAARTAAGLAAAVRVFNDLSATTPPVALH